MTSCVAIRTHLVHLQQLGLLPVADIVIGSFFVKFCFSSPKEVKTPLLDLKGRFWGKSGDFSVWHTKQSELLGQGVDAAPELQCKLISDTCAA